jgi:hypothetical protein
MHHRHEEGHRREECPQNDIIFLDGKKLGEDGVRTLSLNSESNGIMYDTMGPLPTIATMEHHRSKVTKQAQGNFHSTPRDRTHQAPSDFF